MRTATVEFVCFCLLQKAYLAFWSSDSKVWSIINVLNHLFETFRLNLNSFFPNVNAKSLLNKTSYFKIMIFNYGLIMVSLIWQNNLSVYWFTYLELMTHMHLILFWDAQFC